MTLLASAILSQVSPLSILYVVQLGGRHKLCGRSQLIDTADSSPPLHIPHSASVEIGAIVIDIVDGDKCASRTVVPLANSLTVITTDDVAGLI